MGMPELSYTLRHGAAQGILGIYVFLRVVRLVTLYFVYLWGNFGIGFRGSISVVCVYEFVGFLCGL